MIIGFDGTRMTGHSGIERYARELVRALTMLPGNDRYVVATTTSRVDEIGESIGSHQALFVKGGIPHDLMLGAALGRVTRHLQARAMRKSLATVDLVHYTSHRSKTLPDLPYVATVHDLFPMRRPGFAVEVRRIMEGARKVIVPSRYVADTIVERFPDMEHRIVPIHLGVGEPFRPMETDASLPPAMHRLEDMPYFLAVARMDVRKNVPAILDAYRSWMTDGMKARLVLVLSGTTSDVAAFRSTYAEALSHPGIVILPSVSNADLAALYGAAQALLFPSLAEGFGLPVLEAMACGCPVLTSTTTCLPETAGGAALLVDPEQVDEIAHGIDLLHRDGMLRDDLRRKGSIRAAILTWEAAARATHDVYEEAIAGVHR